MNGRVQYPIRFSDAEITIIRQLCRIRRHLDGSTMGATLAALALPALTEALERDPSLAAIADHQVTPALKRKTTPPPTKVVSDYEW